MPFRIFAKHTSIPLFSYRLDLGLPGYTWKACRNLSRPTFHFFFLPSQDFSGGRGQLWPALGIKSSGHFLGWQSACTSQMAVAPEAISVLQDPSKSSWWQQRSLSPAGILGWVRAQGSPHCSKSICRPRPSQPRRSSESNAAGPSLFPTPSPSQVSSPWPLTGTVSKLNFCFILLRSHKLKLCTAPHA